MTNSVLLPNDPRTRNRMATPAPGTAQYCLHQCGKSDKYQLLLSYYPDKNEPGEYSIPIADGTTDELVKFRAEIRGGSRDEKGIMR